MGRGRPKNAITHSTAPSEKNQNSSPAQRRCVTVARAKAVKNVWVRIAQIGSRKIAKINFTQRVGTVSSSDAGTKVLDLARATLRTTFRPRFELRVMRFFFDLRFVAAKVAADYADLHRRKQDRTGDCADIADGCRAGASPAGLGNRSGYSTVNRDAVLRASHVRTGAGVDLDRFAFLNEKRHVNGLAGFELCRLGDVTGGVAAQAFGRFNHL